MSDKEPDIRGDAFEGEYEEVRDFLGMNVRIFSSGGTAIWFGDEDFDEEDTEFGTEDAEEKH